MDENLTPVSPILSLTSHRTHSSSPLLLKTHNINKKTSQLQSCIPCQPGYAATEEGTEECGACPAGTYALTASSEECTPCQTGFYSESAGRTFCDPCPLGTYVDVEGSNDASDCLPCPIGTYGGRLGASECRPCPAGWFSDETGSHTCKPCPGGTAAPLAGNSDISNCTACIGNTTAIPGSANCTDPAIIVEDPGEDDVIYNTFLGDVAFIADPMVAVWSGLGSLGGFGLIFSLIGWFIVKNADKDDDDDGWTPKAKEDK